MLRWSQPQARPPCCGSPSLGLAWLLSQRHLRLEHFSCSLNLPPSAFQARDGTRPRTSIAEGAGCSCCSSTYQCFPSSACVTIHVSTGYCLPTAQWCRAAHREKKGPELLLPPWKQNLGRGRTAAAPAEVTLAKESLIQVTGTITTPAEMQLFFTA